MTYAAGVGGSGRNYGRIEINLPPINGDFEAGITFYDVDASFLPDSSKLPILTQGRSYALHNMIKSNAIAWAYGQFTDVEARKLLVNGVAALIDLGLIREVRKIPDGGSWYKTANQCVQFKDNIILAAELLDVEDMKKAATVAVATKANFWSMNHHTGSLAYSSLTVAGEVKKILDIFYKNQVSGQLVSAANNLGHYASTLSILSTAGIAGLRRTIAVTSVPGASITISNNVKLRFQSMMPAGTDRLAVAYGAATRLVRSVYALFCPAVEEMGLIPPIKNQVMSAPASYHINALYLTGEPRVDYTDTDMEHYLGRLGIFITTLYKHSTLAKSPHMAIARVESYDDYNADFKHTLIRIQQAQAQTRGRIPEALIEQLRVASVEQIQALKNAFTQMEAPPQVPGPDPVQAPSSTQKLK